MRDIRNYNDKGLHHGYQEWYFSNGNIGLKCFFNNGIQVDYEEWYWYVGKLTDKSFYI